MLRAVQRTNRRRGTRSQKTNVRRTKLGLRKVAPHRVEDSSAREISEKHEGHVEGEKERNAGETKRGHGFRQEGIHTLAGGEPKPPQKSWWKCP